MSVGVMGVYTGRGQDGNNTDAGVENSPKKRSGTKIRTLTSPYPHPTLPYPYPYPCRYRRSFLDRADVVETMPLRVTGNRSGGGPKPFYLYSVWHRHRWEAYTPLPWSLLPGGNTG